MRKRRGFLERYQNNEKLDLVGIINFSGCPTLADPEKILKKVKALADYRLDALHLSYCMTAHSHFLNKYRAVIAEAYPDLKIVLGTHIPRDKREFRRDVK
jgi:predicted metal-binding protein